MVAVDVGQQQHVELVIERELVDDRRAVVPVGQQIETGILVVAVARQYDVNANQVFAWRRRFRAATEVATPALVPVTITPEPEETPAPAVSDTIEIEVGGDCRIRVGSNFDGRALKRVLDVLRKR